MKRFILTSALALGTATAATAGNMGPIIADPVVPAPVAPMPVMYDWNGGYVGLGLTYGRSSFSQPTFPEYFPGGTGVGISGLAGYNWQSGNMVYGVEGHLGTARLNGSDIVAGDEIQTDIDGLASIRGRIGVAQDRTLFFATLGAAAGRMTHTAVGIDSQSQTLNGGVIGVGIEHAVSQGLHIRGDLEHYRFRSRDFTTGGAAFDGVQARANVARISAVFRF